MSKLMSCRLFNGHLYRGLRLLCILERGARGKSRSIPIQTLHRAAPMTNLSGWYHLPHRCGSVAIDLRGLPREPGIYLREVATRRPRSDVLARCVPTGCKVVRLASAREH
ncbi:hypothetical protein [Pseudomonas sp. TCU-HL1]|uniref:hypothetical protein n=1 Tax=Pseudomonas sp. TCU-HL1 TaxID=1856685 RepID=UPI000858485C|nr:hypothetical protein [Pseudomonas sp. TCU-HL1]AOE87398.1 hypothetical protein THL1_4850 [Pseudomonas sp. TCU-HL1]